MFVRDFIHVSQPFESVAPRFVSGTGWLQDVTQNAPDSIHYETGPVRARLDSLIVPIVMSGAIASELPQLEADLEISPLGPERSQLTLSATYRRPTDTGPDAVMAQRAAEAGIRRFLQALAASLEKTDVTH
jgi:hypothetical protein